MIGVGAAKRFRIFTHVVHVYVCVGVISSEISNNYSKEV